jgi:hypothetical protein
MSSARAILGLVAALGLTACAVVPPSGPTVLVLPPEGKDLGRFQQEDANCRNYAASQIGPVTGADTTRVSSATLQRRYDVAYVQCMAASGNRLQPPPVGYYSSSLYGYGYPGYYYPGYGGAAYLGFGGYYGGYGYRPYFGPYRHGRGYGPPPPPPPPAALRRPPPPPPPR